jgi:hypothetical protein
MLILETPLEVSGVTWDQTSICRLTQPQTYSAGPARPGRRFCLR